MLASLLITGDISLFVNPRFNWLVGVSMGILILLVWVQFEHLKSKELHQVGILGYLVMSLPVILFLLFPPTALDASMVDKKGITIGNPKQSQKPEVVGELYNGEEDVNDPFYKLRQELLTTPQIQFTDEKYGDILNALHFSPLKFKGKPVKMYGFIYRDENLAENEFILGRYMLTCCSADASVYGVVVKGVPMNGWKENQWVEIIGKLDTEKFEGYDLPVIHYEQMRSIQKPKDPYVYFNY